MITFDPTVFSSSSPQTITLTSTLELSEQSWPEVIQGPGENALSLTISSDQIVGIVQVSGATTAAICGLTISGGSNPTDDGGGILNLGALTVIESIIENNINCVGGLGGGIYNDNTLTVNSSTIDGNSAGLGGGIWNQLVMTVNDCRITNNSADKGGGIDNYYLGTIMAPPSPTTPPGSRWRHFEQLDT